MIRYLVWILSLILLLSLVSCATVPSLNMSNERLLNASPEEGIVIGSIQIKTRKYEGRKLFKYKFKNVKCDVLLQKYKTKYENKTGDPGIHQISATADGDEVPFVAVLPAGQYVFSSIIINVFSDPQRGYMSAAFNVIPGQVTYIGKLEITLPDYGRYGFFVGLQVKDTQDASVTSLESRYSNLDQTISKGLMVGGERKELLAKLANLPPSETVNEYVKVIEGKDYHLRKIVSKAIVEQQLFSPEILAAVSKVLLTEFRMDFRAFHDTSRVATHHIDTMAWYCKILGSSGNKDYIAVLDYVAKESDNRKIKGYAKRYLDQLMENKE